MKTTYGIEDTQSYWPMAAYGAARSYIRQAASGGPHVTH
jgi:hypothetical protein